MIEKKVKFGDLLVEEGLITRLELIKALDKQQEYRKRGENKKLGEILLELGLVSEKQLLEALSKQMGFPFVDLYEADIDYKLMASFPIYLIEQYKVIPFKQDNEYLYIATANPLDYDVIELFEKTSPKPVKIFIALSRDIQVVIERFKTIRSTMELAQKVKRELKLGGNENSTAIDELVSFILKKAIEDRISDIHIEPQKNNFIVRGRVDGVLKEIFAFDKEIYSPLVSKFKQLAGLDISEKRKPQDGRFTRQFQFNNNGILEIKSYDFRISTTPTLHGESIVIRILDQDKILLRMSSLGMSDYNLKKFEKLITSPYGIVLVTGPTGSGKTTTLYAAINEIKSIDKKIITIEDPVEYELQFIQQIPVNAKIGLTFATILRSVLRQDPDVIMIGEIRDKDTITSSIQAALTGHLVLATLHTNDAVSAITRIQDMGVQNYLIADAVNGIVAQRLIRKICPHCKTEYRPPKEEIELIKPYLKDEDVKFYRGRGCSYCDFTGYLGREMINEILVINDHISQLIALNKDKREIVKVAKEFGFISMAEDGINKLKQGKTTIEEILRVVKLDVV